MNKKVKELTGELARLRTELDRLRESERMYRAAAELAGRLVWATDAKGRVTSISRIFHDLSGMAPEAVAERWSDAVHPEDRDRVLAEWSGALSSGDRFTSEFRVLLPGGSSRSVLTRAVARRDEEGSVSRWYGSTEDVEEERRSERARLEAEKRLRESEELYRNIVELSQQMVWSASPGGRLLTVSPRFREVTGIPPSVEPEAAFEAILHPDDRPALAAGWRGAVEKGSPYEAEFRIRVADGSYRLFAARTAPRRDEMGLITGWYGTTEDIQNERQADSARREAEERYRLVARVTNDVIWDYDIVAGTVDWSDTAASVFSWPKPLGRTHIDWWKNHIHALDRARVVESFEAAISGRDSRWEEAYRFCKGDGSHADLLDRGFIIRAPDASPIRAVGAIVDTTERRRADAEIRRMQAELVHVSRVSAMGAMASTLAHELNQPLTAVANYVRGARRLIGNAGAADADVSRALEAAEAGSLRAGEIVRRLRELVSRGRAMIAVVDLERIVEEAATLAFVDAHLRGVSHEVVIEPSARWVQADRIQIEQVLINLVRNSIQAMDGSDLREIRITAAAAGGMVEVRVADTGCGLAPDQIETLFTQFMTTKVDGMGVGLPISRTIVEAHGGKIWAEPRASNGSVFCFTLPRAEAGERAAGPRAAAARL